MALAVAEQTAAAASFPHPAHHQQRRQHGGQEEEGEDNADGDEESDNTTTGCPSSPAAGAGAFALRSSNALAVINEDAGVDDMTIDGGDGDGDGDEDEDDSDDDGHDLMLMELAGRGRGGDAAARGGRQGAACFGVNSFAAAGAAAGASFARADRGGAHGVHDQLVQQAEGLVANGCQVSRKRPT